MLELANVTLKRGSHVVLDSLTCRFESGERILVSGPNGVGKTSLLEVCAGLLAPQSGKVLFLQRELSQRNMPEIQYASERLIAIPELTVAENLRCRARLLAQWGASPEYSDAIERFALGPVLHTFPHALSKGFQRRLSLALATLGAPKVLLLDEPTAALDSEGIDLLKSYLSALSPEILSLVVTHEPEILQSLFTRCVHCSSTGLHTVLANGTQAGKGQPLSVTEQLSV